MITLPQYRQIKPEHLQEWRASAVCDAIIALNVESLIGESAIEAVAGNQLEKVGAHGQQYVTQETKRILERYKHLEYGGWGVTGVDPVNGYSHREFGHFKPDVPRLDSDGKPIKYEQQPGVDAVPVFLFVPWLAGFRTAFRYGKEESYGERFLQAFRASQRGSASEAHREAVSGTVRLSDRDRERFIRAEDDCTFTQQLAEWAQADYETIAAFLRREDSGYWGWIRGDVTIPLQIVEGSKKAGSQITLGYPTIALPGIWMGYRAKPQPHLAPDLEFFAQPGRLFVFVFDEDTKPRTRDDVQKAEFVTGKHLKKQGCTVLTTEWSPSEAKGIDDLHAAAGAARIEEVIASAKPLEQRGNGKCRLTRFITKLTHYLSAVEIGETAAR